jgi:hypothetical protein
MALRPTPKKMTPDDLRNGIKRLQTRIEELEAFDPSKMTENFPPELQACRLQSRQRLPGSSETERVTTCGFCQLATCNGVRGSTPRARRSARFLIT